MATKNQERGVDLLDQLRDELELQAWLAGAELRHPSAKHPRTRGEIDALVRLRDELRVQLHLGRLEARDRFEEIERRWQDVKQLAASTAEEAGDALHDLLKTIRDGYAGLRGDHS